MYIASISIVLVLVALASCMVFSIVVHLVLGLSGVPGPIRWTCSIVGIDRTTICCGLVSIATLTSLTVIMASAILVALHAYIHIVRSFMPNVGKFNIFMRCGCIAIYI